MALSLSLVPAPVQDPTCECQSLAEPKALSFPGQPLISPFSPSCTPSCSLGTWPGHRPGHHAPLLPGRKKKDVLTAQAGLDSVSVSH